MSVQIFELFLFKQLFDSHTGLFFCPVVLNSGRFCPPGDMGQRLEIFLLVMTGRGTMGIWWISDADKPPITHRTTSHSEEFPALMSVVLKLRNPVLVPSWIPSLFSSSCFLLHKNN